MFIKQSIEQFSLAEAYTFAIYCSRQQFVSVKCNDTYVKIENIQCFDIVQQKEASYSFYFNIGGLVEVIEIPF